jgi:hypothetical protein
VEKKVTPAWSVDGGPMNGTELLAKHDWLESEGDRDALRVWLNGLSLDESHALAQELGKRTIARINEEDRKAR